MATKHIIQNPNYFQCIDNPTKAYFVGFIAADGCIQQITKSSRGVSITLKSCDIEVLEKLKSELNCSNHIMVFERPQTFNPEVITEFCRLQIIDKSIVEGLENLGITERKSLTLCDFISNIPIDLRKYAILGYFDGDGGFVLPQGKFKTHKAGDRYQIKSKSIHAMIRGTNAVLQSIKRELNLTGSRIAQYDAAPRLSITHKDEIVKLLDIYVGSTFFLQRKWDKIQDRLSTWIIQ